MDWLTCEDPPNSVSLYSGKSEQVGHPALRNKYLWLSAAPYLSLSPVCPPVTHRKGFKRVTTEDKSSLVTLAMTVIYNTSNNNNSRIPKGKGIRLWKVGQTHRQILPDPFL